MAPDDPVLLGDSPLDGVVRRVRRQADLSQRQLAEAAGMSAATVGGIESGQRTPSLAVLQRILAVAGYRIAVVDRAGRFVEPLQVWPEVADLADRRFPAHLDTILDPRLGEWWADQFGLTAPPETFRRSRDVRDYERRRSRWEVRVKQLRFAPEPMPPLRRQRPDWD